MLTDDSAGEQCAVRKAFPGLSAGETEVKHLLCRVHSQRTIRHSKHLQGDFNRRAREHLAAALYNRRTRAGAEESVGLAIAAVNGQVAKEYIRKEWLATLEDWAHFARAHSPLLLQTPNTNDVESWHAVLKRGEKAEMHLWSLKGTMMHVRRKAYEYSVRAEKAELEFRGKHLSETADCPGMRQLPLPMQRLICEERRIAMGMLKAGDGVERDLGDDGTCDCRFFQKWLLPCRHLWMAEVLWGGVLPEERWKEWAYWFEESGFDFYEERYLEREDREEFELIGAPQKRRLQVCFSALQIQANRHRYARF